MIFATIEDGSRDGRVVLVDRSQKHGFFLKHKTLQNLLDQWNSIDFEDQKLEKISLEDKKFLAPLPRAYGFADGSAFLNHVILVRKARNAPIPETLKTDPLMYQGGSDDFLPPRSDIVLRDESWGCDFESEFVVVTDDVPMGVDSETALNHIKLIGICNDVSLRNLIPKELEKGFGFLQSKPATSFGPFFVTPDELGSFYQKGRVLLDLETNLNGKFFGNPNGKEMHFHFGELISHLAKTRNLIAGTIIGSGTVSNEDRSRGSSCIAEVRMLEIIDSGAAKTNFLKFEDVVEIDCKINEKSVFGKIKNKVSKWRE